MKSPIAAAFVAVFAAACGATTPRPAAPAPIVIAAQSVSPTAPLQWTVAPCSERLVFVRRGRVDVTDANGAKTSVAERSAARVTRPGVYTAQGEADLLVADVTPGDLGCTAPDDMRILPAAQAPVYQPGANFSVQLYLEGEATRPAPSSLEVLDAAAGFAAPVHTHDGAVEAIYIESGSGTMRDGDATRPIHAGDTIVVPKGKVHDFRVNGTGPLRAVQFYAPSGPEQRFKKSAPEPHECPCKTPATPHVSGQQVQPAAAQ